MAGLHVRIRGKFSIITIGQQANQIRGLNYEEN